ncbi:DUF6249 domain-containing protein [Brevundimonas bacteroides]|jgi:hypothetical protein|uniref:DUF6249 domain-containing protein n=1 Tax=Brevundimonas bacteroides TaxID=74311 RepID=UPI000495489E|nr:DUF6249 domain-containing protein [Brevundimonas bacteroides]
MELTPVLIVGTIFASLVAIIVGPSWLKSRDRREVQQTVRAAIEKGQPLPPEVIDALSKEATRNLPSRSRDLRQGIIWLAVGIGLAAFGTISEMRWGSDGWEGPDFGGLLGIAAIPATIGLAFIVLSFFNKNKD